MITSTSGIRTLDLTPCLAKAFVAFADNNHDAFGVTTWAYIATDVDDSTQKYFVPAKLSTFNNYQGVEVSGSKLSDSAMEYKLWDITEEPTVALELKPRPRSLRPRITTLSFVRVSKKPILKGIYFAETEKTIAIGESYTPVVMGVATNKKVDATILPGDRTAIQVIDVTDGETVIGTQEGVAYITAEYAPATLVNKDDAKEINYTANSMKVTVTAQGATDDDDDDKDGKTYIVTASSLRVRSGAGTNFSQIGSLKNGATVKVESIANGWAKPSRTAATSPLSTWLRSSTTARRRPCTSPPAPSTSARAPAPPTRRPAPSPAAPLCRWSASPATGRS